MIKSLEDNCENLQFIKLDNDYKTTFWRYHHNSVKCVCSLEAIYYFFKELGEVLNDRGILDNLENILFFYILQFRKIQEAYEMKNKRVCDKNEDYFKK